MKCTILNIGDELLIGQTLNTNAAWMSQKMNEIGIDVIHHISLSDERNDIENCLNNALNDSTIVLITGGLGPTSDDITKQVLCDFFGGKLVFNEAAYKNIERIFEHRKKLIDEATKQVAFLPDNCLIIPNNNGTAAGMIFNKDGKTIVSMPGVPHEMKAMLDEALIPYLKQTYQLPFILHCNILTAGVGETQLASRLEQFEKNKHSEIKLAYLPSIGKVRLRLTIKGNDKLILEQHLSQAKSEVCHVIDDYIYGFEDDTLEQKIGALLLEKKYTLATAESCTGGYLAHLITSVAGSSSYYKGSIISYANETKENLLQVHKNTLLEYGAVSKQTVNEMLAGALQQLKTDVAIAISGIAGPDGGTTEKPVGTVFIGVGTHEQKIIKRFALSSHRDRNIQAAGIFALEMLRKFLLNKLNE
ncbi:MAG TPA: competence/damage-inducible protein A [Chitinophagales bacterium]|nr:competence/damage-inducible protein A [Chitinophagales bacterium]